MVMEFRRKSAGPSKIKHFIWICCRDCIPTSKRLQQKGISVPCGCLFFYTNMENSWHVLLHSIIHNPTVELLVC